MVSLTLPGSLNKYYLLLFAFAVVFSIICVLISYFYVNDSRLGLFGILYLFMLSFGFAIYILIHVGAGLGETNALTAFVVGLTGLLVVSIILQAITKQWSFLVSINVPPLATTSQPVIFNVSPSQILNVLMNVPGPIAEENFFRIFLYRIISLALGKYKSVVAQAIIFGIFHSFAYGFSIPQICIAIAAGLVLGLIYAKWESETANCGAHLIYNLIALAISGATGIVLMKV